MIIDILQEKRDRCLRYAKEVMANDDFYMMQYYKGMASAYSDAMELMKNVEIVIGHKNLARLIGRFVKKQNVGPIIENIRINIRKGFESLQDR